MVDTYNLSWSYLLERVCEVSTIPVVCTTRYSELYNDELSNPNIVYRCGFYKQVQELVSKFNYWFDLCNSRDPGNRKNHWVVNITRNNGIATMYELLSPLAWLYERRTAVTVDGKVDWSWFVTEETFESIHFVNY